MGVGPEEVVVVEDSANGLRAALGAGLRTVVTVSSYTADEDFTGASLVVSSLGDLPDTPARSSPTRTAWRSTAQVDAAAPRARSCHPERERTAVSDARVESVVRTIAQTCIENEKYFGDLDSVVGDGDFGFSLARGFENVLAQWDTFDRTDTGTFLQKVAIVMTGRIGGTSGPIWGTAFLRAARPGQGQAGRHRRRRVAMLRAAIEGIKARGGADLGEKTLLDALAPMTDTIEAGARGGSSQQTSRRRGRVTARDARRGDQPHAGPARTRLVHRRAQHRLARPGRGRRRGAGGAGRRQPGDTHVRAPGATRRQVTTEHDDVEERLMKKFVNDPKNFVPEMLKGIALANPDTLRYVPEYNLIMRADAPSHDKVSIIQGSGSGHEPAHVMVVGKGMLDGACPGDVFAAPPMEYVLETAKLLASDKGVLLLVNNYTGDKMAFEMAAELAEAEGLNVRTLFINDDVAVKDSTWTVGRRGVAGNFFVMKAVGAAAEAGRVARRARPDRREGQLGHPDHGHRPDRRARRRPRAPRCSSSADDEMEVGVGIHGEPGRRRAKLVSADEIVDELLGAVVPDLPYSSGDGSRS